MAKKATTKKKTTRKTKRVKKADESPERDETPAEVKKTTAAAKKTKKKAAARKKTAAAKTTTRKAAKKKTATARKTTKTTRRKTTAAEESATAEAPREADGKSPQIEQNDGGIVIRFPSANPSPGLAADKDAPAIIDDDVIDEVIEEAVSDDMIDDEPPVAAAPAEPAADRGEDEPAEDAPRRKRRRRRRRGGDREATDTTEARRDAEPDEDEARPEPAEVAEPRDEDDEAPPTERTGRRRRRRRGRGRGQSEAVTEEAAEAAPAPAMRIEPDAPTAADDDEDDDWREEVGPLSDADPDVREPEEDDDDDRPKRRRRRGRRGRKPESEAEPAEIQVADPPKVTRKDMIINVAPREECRIGILENGKLEEIYLERASASNHVGNIYKGVVTNVEASIQAAFIDFGLGKNGFLHVSDLHPQYFPPGERQSETIGRKMPRRNRPPIQQCLRRGQELLVQITKEGIGTKGPTLTTYLSVPGRYMVMLPGMRRVGVSRKIEDEEIRSKLRAAMSELDLPDDIGFIARTAASERSKKELQADLKYLQRLWQAVEKRLARGKAPAELYRESDLVTRTIRDVYAADIDRIVVDDPEVAERAREFLAIFSPKARDSVEIYEGQEPIFYKYGIEQELDRLHARQVPLPSGGSLVIDQTEALVAIDVNSGKFRTEADAETTAFKINLEAADEIPRQLRLRDLGGVVVCDFIDMRLDKHKREIERRLGRNLKAHKERAKVLRTSQFGLIELTRQRQRASLTRSVYEDCRHCQGKGLVKTPESVTLDVMRMIQLAATQDHIRTIEVTVANDVAQRLQNHKRALLADLERRTQRAVVIRGKATIAPDSVTIECTDSRGRIVPYTVH